MFEKTLSVKEAAVVLNVQPNTIRAWISDGRLPAEKVGKAFIIPEAEVEKLVAVVEAEARAGNPLTEMTREQRIAFFRQQMDGCSLTPEMVVEERNQEQVQSDSHNDRCDAWR